ncbi:MAG: OmpA family protein [Crocinitomicaceae bacterium]|nr:OmpA family protein [Crocinitomicaceae bacterium]
MKKLLVSLFIVFTTISFAQNEPFDRWSISYALGGHFWTKPMSSYKADLTNLQVSHHDINGRYMFNNRMGIMLDFGYNFFDFKGLDKQNTHFIRTTVQSVINIGDMIKLNTLSKRFGLLLHAGLGYSRMWQKVPAKISNDMVNMVIGITPQLRIAPRWSLKGDVSFVANHRQKYTFDFLGKLNTLNTLNFSGMFFDVSVGVTYHIGKNKNHADWVATKYCCGTENASSFSDTEIEDLKERIRLLEEHLKDDDNDGVINKRDLEPKSTAGAIVNSLGVTIEEVKDTDGDGLPDNIDECPTEPGRIMGCPDRDNDGIPDKDDECPDEYGKPENKGCPLAKETMERIKQISESTYFDTGKATIKSESFEGLNNFSTILKENPEVQVAIEGHTDNQGRVEFNLNLSKERAAAVREYIISQGVDPGRVTSEGYGDSRPIADNETEEGRAKNRRVEIHTSVKEIIEKGE